MSGGSMGYLYSKVDEASFSRSTPARRAFRAHLTKVSKALKAIEWNDSGDGADNEEALILACLSPTATLDQSIEDAKRVMFELDQEIQKAKALQK